MTHTRELGELHTTLGEGRASGPGVTPLWGPTLSALGVPGVQGLRRAWPLVAMLYLCRPGRLSQAGGSLVGGAVGTEGVWAGQVGQAGLVKALLAGAWPPCLVPLQGCKAIVGRQGAGHRAIIPARKISHSVHTSSRVRATQGGSLPSPGAEVWAAGHCSFSKPS